MQRIYLKTATLEQLEQVDVLDWIEGYGDVTSIAEAKFIRKYGKLLLSIEEQNSALRKGMPLGPIIGSQTIIEQQLQIKELKEIIQNWLDQISYLQQLQLQSLIENSIRALEEGKDESTDPNL